MRRGLLFAEVDLGHEASDHFVDVRGAQTNVVAGKRSRVRVVFPDP